MRVRARATKPQTALVNSTAPYPAFVGGYGSGKTHALLLRTLTLIFGDGGNIAYYLPTYPLIKTIAYPRFTEALDGLGVPYKINKSDHIIDVNGKQIIFRTMDNPERIVGYEVSDSMVDELDTMPTDKARDCWNRIIARNRQKKKGKNTVAVGTTPEGYRFVYEKWVKERTPSYEIIRAPTYSNPHLPEDYVDLLRETYPAQLLEAYLEGEFVNLTSGSVYSNFSREAQDVDTTITKGEPLHIGLDFNIYHMAAVVHVMRKGKAHAVSEITGGVDTPAVIKTLKERYGDHPIIIYPDASGGAGSSTGAAQSDIKQLKQAGFSINAPRRNGRVKDRVASFNRALLDPMGNTRYCVNIEQCPSLALSLEQQAYDKNGDPDKSSGLDHILDAAGYFVVRQFPIKLKPKANQPKRWS